MPRDISRKPSRGVRIERGIRVMLGQPAHEAARAELAANDGKRARLGTYPDREHGAFNGAVEDQRVSSSRCSAMRKQRDLAGDNGGIVGMRKISVRSRYDQRLARQHNDARGPARPERRENPEPQALQRGEDRQRRQIDVLIAAPHPQRPAAISYDPTPAADNAGRRSRSHRVPVTSRCCGAPTPSSPNRCSVTSAE